MKKILFVCLVVITGIGLPGSAVFAVDSKPGMNQFLDGLEAYDRGAYDEALISFSKAIEEDRSNLQFQYHYGLSYAKQGKDQEAVSIFSAILARDPNNYGNLYFDIAAVYTGKKDYENAEKTLNDADKAMPGNPQVKMEKGHLAARMKKPAEAEANYRKAMELKPDLAQAAYYHIALVHAVAGKYESAGELFKKAIAASPGTDLARSAQAALDNLGAMKKTLKPWHVFIDLSYSYDDNIPNDPLDKPGYSVNPPVNLGDQYQTFAMNAWYTFAFSNRMALDAGYMFTYQHYNNSNNQNIMGNSPYLLMKYSANPWSMDLRYGFTYYTADGHKKERQHELIPSIALDEPMGMRTELNLVMQDKTYLDDGITPDARHLALGARQLFRIPDSEIRPRIGMSFGKEKADTPAATYSFLQMDAGVESKLPYKFQGDLSVSGIFSNYDVVYGSEKRKDKAFIISAALSRKLMDSVLGRISYMHVRNDSNVMTSGLAPDYDPYEYRKNIVQLQVEVGL